MAVTRETSLAIDVGVNAFFAEVADGTAGYDADNIYPDGQKFLFTFFSLNNPDVTHSKEDGQTALGPYYDIGGDSFLAEAGRSSRVLSSTPSERSSWAIR